MIVRNTGFGGKPYDICKKTFSQQDYERQV